jgi:pimeloyl-ACP methyl ester carboxylesterase
MRGRSTSLRSARRRETNRRSQIAALLVAAPAALAACLQIETFFFAGRPIDGYRWDEASPELDGDLSDPHPSLVPPEEREEGFVALADGTPIHWVFAHRAGAMITILYSHGNGPHLGRFWDRVERLWELGYHVVVYDYPGYGRSGGHASEQGLENAADAVFAILPTLRDVDPSRVVVYGYSLGCVPAFHLAPRGARALIGEACWCSMEEQIRDGAFLDLPRELLTHLEMDNCARIAELGPEVPVLLIHGTEDRVSSPRQARLLAARARHPPTLRWVEGSRHAEVPNRAGALYGRWIAEHLASALAPE